uniref:uncharacterized protein LOC122601123 n=1 Tax=Erigeron canadensis TaxID=72917 RepID=UPI001CB96950|nr:uncharacterized protein LOC122601123 [Erigeron canadensis]
MGDSYSQPVAALVASMSEHPSSISNEIVPYINDDIPVISHPKSVYAESECDESDGDELANEVAMLAERIRRRSFNKFKGKGKSGQADKTNKPFDMSKVTCYKCGKTGHMVGDCRSKESSQAVPAKGGRSEKYSKIKTKYKALKAQVAEMTEKVNKSEKSLVATDRAKSATSYDDELYKDAKCFMAKEATLKLNRLGDEVLLQKHFNQELKKEIHVLKLDISSKFHTIEKLESEVKAQKQLNSILVKEAKTAEEKFLKVKQITESWCICSKRTAKYVNDQIPHQIQAIFYGDYDRTIAIAEVYAMEPCYQPPSSPKVQTKGKNYKPIKLVQKYGIGFSDPETMSQTITEAMSKADKVVELKPEESLDLSKLTITQSMSDSVTKSNKGNSKKNKRKVREHSVPKEKTKILKNEESSSLGNESQTKSEYVSKDTKSDSDKMISKYVESRTGEVSNNTNFLENVSDPEIVNQRKLRAECKKSEIGKSFVQKETLNVAKKNFKSGKGQTKKQWIFKYDKSLNSVVQPEATWHLDSGCSKHMTGCKSLLSSFRIHAGPNVTFGDDSQGKTGGFGILSNGHSVSQLCDAGYEVRFRSDKGIVLDLEGNVVLIAKRDESLYSFDMRNPTVTRDVCFMSKTQDKLNCEKGISQVYSVARTPQQNGVAERLNRTLIEAARSIMAQNNVKSHFWTEAVHTACFTQNRSLIVKRHQKTAYELLRGRKPEIGFLRMFGSPCYILNQKDHLGKFDEKADEGILLGYATMMKAYIVYNKRIRTIENSVNVSIEDGCSKPDSSPLEDEDFDFEKLAIPENEPPTNPPVGANGAQTQGEQLIEEEEEVPIFEDAQADLTPTEDTNLVPSNVGQAGSDSTSIVHADHAGPSNLNQHTVSVVSNPTHMTK